MIVILNRGTYRLEIDGDGIHSAELTSGQPWPKYEDNSFSPLEHALAKEVFELQRRVSDLGWQLDTYRWTSNRQTKTRSIIHSRLISES